MAAPISRTQQYYRHLIALYPSSYRSNYGLLEVQLFDDVYRDSSALSDQERRLILFRAYADTLLGIVREQSSNLRDKLSLKKGDPMHDKPKRPLWRTLAYIAAPLIIIAVGGSFLGWWNTLSYRAHVIYNLYMITDTQNTNVGQDDVTASFVDEYVKAKNFGGNNSSVGYKSAYAVKDTIENFKTLQQAINEHYSHIDAGFDPLICSNQAPSSVTYTTLSNSFGNAQVLAAYSYPGKTEKNLALYYLSLFNPGENSRWKVGFVSCPTLDNADSRPYTLTYPPSEYFTHTFGK